MATAHRTLTHSPYLVWAKLSSQARFNLATSGVAAYPLAKLPVRFEELEISGPGGTYGFPPLQQRLAKLQGVSEECVVAAIGTSMANFLAYAGMLEAGDEVLVESPAYGPMFEAPQFLGATVRRFERRFENSFALDPSEVQRAVTPRTRVIALTNLHNPSGVFATTETLKAVGDIAEKIGAKVLVDEVYLDMLFDPAVRSSFHLGEHFVVTSSLTKVYGLSGLRCGWILASPDLARAIWRINDLFGNIPSFTAEQLSVIAIDHLPEIRLRSRELLARNRAILDQFLGSTDELELVRPPAGTVIFPRLKRGSAEDFVRRLREKYETSVVPGRFFEMPGHFRLGIGGDSEQLRAGLERVSSALSEFSKAK